jgi:hypothetical protein
MQLVFFNPITTDAYPDAQSAIIILSTIFLNVSTVNLVIVEDHYYLINY